LYANKRSVIKVTTERLFNVMSPAQLLALILPLFF